MEKPAQARVVGKLSDARDKGVGGVVACAGCRSTKGSLVGKTFMCDTWSCKFYRFKKSAPASPWVRSKK